MKRGTCFLLAIVYIILGSSFKNKSSGNQGFDVKETTKQFVQVSQQLWISRYEVTNLQYRIFLQNLQASNQTDLYNKSILDTALWMADSKKGKPFAVYYHSHTAYNNYPVVTVSYNSANEYCKWLTQQYNSDAKRKFKKVIFRLPTEQEWTRAASAGDSSISYPWGNGFLMNRQGMKLCNYHRIGDQAITFNRNIKDYEVLEKEEKVFTTFSPVQSYFPNAIGLYNVSGNAAEMIAEEGIAKGGSFNDPGYDVRISSTKQYKGASFEVGFRVAMEIIEQ